MSLEESKNTINLCLNEKETINFDFVNIHDKLIIKKEYPSKTSIKEAIEDFKKNNDVYILKSYFNYRNNFDKCNLNFYNKDNNGKFKKIYIKNFSYMKKDDSEEKISEISKNNDHSFSTSQMTNLEYLKIYVNYENIYKNIVENMEEYIINTTYLIAKPILNTKIYYLYNKYIKEIKMIPLTNEDINKNKIDPFSNINSYCNAKNNLYIYESNYKDNNNKYSNFFNIDLTENKVELISSTFPKRRLHSMIYIPSSYIFIIGGQNTKEVLIYEMKGKNNSYDTYPHLLKEELLEPSLISINNKYIYIFENNTYKLNIYRFNLFTLLPFEEIKISNKINFPQKFFGVVKNKNSIIFLGGQMIDIFNNQKNNNSNCFEFNYDTFEIIVNKKEFIPWNFIEKTFIPIENGVYMQFVEYKKDDVKETKILCFDGKEKEYVYRKICFNNK
jgi:hypothetical protein